MDVEHRVICAVLASGSTRELADAMIGQEHFASPEHRRVYQWVLAHQARYGRVPDTETLLDAHPGYTLDAPPEPIGVYLDLLRGLHRERVLKAGLLRAVEALDAGNAAGSEQELAGVLRALAAVTPSRGHLDLRASAQARLEGYRALAEGEGLRGIPTGFPTIDRATLGLQPGQLIVIGGLAKRGKSVVLANIGKNAHQAAHRAGTELVPLLVTIEMSNAEMGGRLDAWYAGLDDARVRGGSLNQAEWARLERSIDELSRMPSFHLEKGISHVTTLSQIAAKIERHQPDLLLVDGIYLMRDEMTGEVGTPQAITSITQGFKSLADRYEIPTVITSQFLAAKVGKKGPDAFSFGYSSSFAMDADVALAVDSTDAETIRSLRIVASRNCPNLEVFLNWDWSRGVFEEMDDNPFGAGAGGSVASPW